MSLTGVHMANLKKNFGRQLKKIRVERHITQDELARITDLSSSFISNMERGINGPSFEVLEALGIKLKIPIKALFDFDEK